MPYIKKALFALISMACFLVAPVNACPESINEQFLRHAKKNFCQGSSPEKIFILLDGTDGFSQQSRDWVMSNIFHESVLNWEQQGAEITVALLGQSSVADLERFHVCTPKHKSSISYITDQPRRVKRDNTELRCAVKRTADRFLNYQGASSSVLIEAVGEIFRNPVYQFGPQDSSNEKAYRKFYVVSDLFQNSGEINFFSLCNGGRCPTYHDLVTREPSIARYLEKTMPNLNDRDEIFIFNINVANRFNRDAYKFWEDYFIAAGALPQNIKTVTEFSR